MKNNHNMMDDILDKQYYNNLSQQDDYCLSEIDFYPPSDSRCLESYVEDIDNGDNFADYCEELFELLEEEGYWD